MSILNSILCKILNKYSMLDDKRETYSHIHMFECVENGISVWDTGGTYVYIHTEWQNLGKLAC